MESTAVNDTRTRELGLGSSDPAAARAAVYAMLSACFSPPDARLLEDAGNGALAAALAGALAELPGDRDQFGAVLEGFEALEEALAPSGGHGALQDLEVEYTRLFLGPGLPVLPPYESVYLDQEAVDVPGSLWGPATLAVRDAYREAGLAPRPGPEPPDHLAAELEFVAFLSQSEADALAGGDTKGAEGLRRRRTSFLASHLSRWAPGIADRTVREAQHPLYRAAGGLLRAVLAADG